MAVSTQSSISKYCTLSDLSFGSACWAQDASQTGQGTYCSISGVPSLSVAVRAKWEQRRQLLGTGCGCSEQYPRTLSLAGFISEILSVPPWTQGSQKSSTTLGCLIALVLIFKAGFVYIAEAGLKLKILGPQLPKCWGYSIYHLSLPSGDILDRKTVDPKGLTTEGLPHGLDSE